MDEITRDPKREIIEDFAEEIKAHTLTDAKPSKVVIFFRSEHISNTERDVVRVPIDLLRFRKDNGRIASDVLSYEKDKGPLSERSSAAQTVLRDFLEKNDPESTEELVNSIYHSGQRDPAIITADGFLINGNRRKVALLRLFKKYQTDQWKWMKVVILPGRVDPGGPPTLKEIEQIENRYQLQREGKSEYSRFNKALSIRNKINKGMSLVEQLSDDPSFISLTQKEKDKLLKEYEIDYLEPLSCVDRYLQLLGREGLYTSIASGTADKEGRWEAFLDYYARVRRKLDDANSRNTMGIEEDEIGDVEEIAFKIIRKREFPELPKLHMIMRDFSKLISNKEAKKELYKLLDIEFDLPRTECYNSEGKEYSEREKDQIWGNKNATKLIGRVKDAKKIVEYETARETPLTLLEAALKKLNHENMTPEAVAIEDIEKAANWANQIQTRAHHLYNEFDHLKNDTKEKLKALKNKYAKNKR